MPATIASTASRMLLPAKLRFSVAEFWLDPFTLQKAGGFSRNELNRIARLVYEHKDRLLESWYEFFGD